MSQSLLEHTDFDKYLSLSEKAIQAAAIASNDAFVKALTMAIKRGREIALPGTFIDLTPPIGAFRLRGTIAISACGSPAAMCVERGVNPGGAEMLR